MTYIFTDEYSHDGINVITRAERTPSNCEE